LNIQINDVVLCLDVYRVKKMTKMTESVANGVLTGVVKVSGYFTSSVANSKAGKKFFSFLPGEVVLASLDGFSTSVILIPGLEKKYRKFGLKGS